MRTIFFVTNFTVAVLLVIACILALVQPDSAYSFLGGLMLLPPAAGAAISEWLVWYRCQYTLEKVLGGLCVAFGALNLFGVITSPPVEALQTSWPEDFEWLLGILFVVG